MDLPIGLITILSIFIVLRFSGVCCIHLTIHLHTKCKTCHKVMLVSQILLHNILDIWIYFFFAGHSCAVTAKSLFTQK